MAPCQSRQLVIYSLPFAVLVAFFWYRRRRSLSRSDPGGTATVDESKTSVEVKHGGKELDEDILTEKLNVTSAVTETEVVRETEVVSETQVVRETEEVRETEVVNETQVVRETEVVCETEDSVTVEESVATQSTPAQPTEEKEATEQKHASSPGFGSDEIFHSTVIEDEKDSLKLDQEESNVGSEATESGDLEQTIEYQEKQTSSTSDLKTEGESVNKRNCIPFEEQSTIENFSLKKHKKAAKKAEKRSRRQEKYLKASALFNKTDSVKKDQLSLSKNNQEVEGLENASSDSGCPASEDSNNAAMAQGQKSEEKTDSSSAGLEQKLASLGLDTVQVVQRVERDSANHSPAEVMLNSPAISTYSDAHSEGSSDSGKGCSDVVTPPSRTPAGGSSVAGDQVPSIYEFVLPQVIVGRLIGRHGAFLHDIRAKTHTNVFIKRHPETTTLKICSIEGTQQDIDAALKMIRQKFPQRRFPELTLERVSFVKNLCLPVNPENLQLNLVEGLNNDVIISSLISAGHFFLQLPSHMSYQSLYRLACFMNSVYNSQESPCILEPRPDVVCVAPAHGNWYRAQILSVDKETDTSNIKFMDYGGYMTVNNSTLRQIRGDFLMLPFQAVECVLANVVPAGGEEEWSEEAKQFVYQMTTQQTLQAQVYDYTETGLPLVYLYCTHFYYSPTDLGVYESKVVLLNEELVSRGFADLIEPAPEGEEEETAVAAESC